MNHRTPQGLAGRLLVGATLIALVVATPLLAGAEERRVHFHKGLKPKARPARIVSLAPVLTESLFALGVGDRVAGVTRFCDRPEEAKQLPKIGGFIDPQLEVILGLEPDLVVAMPSSGQRRVLDRLVDQGVPVMVGFGDSIAEVRNLVLGLGQAVDAAKRADEIVLGLDSDLAALRGKLTEPGRPSPRVLIAVGARPLVAAGRGTFGEEAITLLGAKPALDEIGPAWPALSAEAVAALAPDVIIASQGPEAVVALEAELAGLGPRRPPVVALDRPILQRPGPHLAADVQALAKLIERSR